MLCPYGECVRRARLLRPGGRAGKRGRFLVAGRRFADDSFSHASRERIQRFGSTYSNSAGWSIWLRTDFGLPCQRISRLITAYRFCI